MQQEAVQYIPVPGYGNKAPFLVASVDSAALALPDSLLEATGQQSAKRRTEKAAADFLLKTMLQDQELHIRNDESGQPRLIGRQGYISVSHSRNIVALQYSEKLHCGIDVQHFEDRVLRLKEKFLNAYELDFVNALPDADKVTYITTCWSVKEVVYKIHGAGFIDYHEGFRIRPFRLDGSPIRCDVSTGGIEDTFTIQYSIHNEYIIAYRSE
ncbi:MAG: 4'-phosphopantetheinyl transferase family protein [Flavobacteriales bacterium]